MTPGGIDFFDNQDRNQYQHQNGHDRYAEKRSRLGSDDGFPVKSETGHRAKKRKP